jgi:hypothetical protein
MQYAITNGLLRQGWATAVETSWSPQVHTGMEDRTWDHHITYLTSYGQKTVQK